MAVCTGCGGVFDWGYCEDRWVPLEPVDNHADLDRKYVDEDGVLRADHRDRHPGGKSINVVRLDRRVLAADADTEAPKHRRFAEAARRAVGKG